MISFLKNIKDECSHRLNIIKSTVSKNWSVKLHFSVKTYQNVIFSKLDYNPIVYDYTKPSIEIRRKHLRRLHLRYG